MKTRSLVTLLVTLLLIVLVGALAVNGLTVGKYIVKPVGSAIKLGLDLRGGIYAVYKGDSSVEDFETLRNATVTIMINRAIPRRPSPLRAAIASASRFRTSRIPTRS